MPACVYAVDRTRPSTFIAPAEDGSVLEPGADFEYARGRAQRAALQLQAVVSMPYTDDRAAIASRLRRTLEELSTAVAVLENREVDLAGYFDEAQGKFVTKSLGAKANDS